MKWYYATDAYYFQDKEFVQNNGVQLINPDKYELKLSFLKGQVPIVLASFPPFSEVKDIYTVEILPNKYGFLASQDLLKIKSKFGKDYRDFNGDEKLQAVSFIAKDRLGLEVYRSSVTLRDIGGMFTLKQFISRTKTLDKLGIPDFKIKGVFLVGIPGTGKSFSAKAMAGETNRLLVSFNIAKLLENDNPVYTLLKTFELLEELQTPSVLWIDEIEKVFTGSDYMERRIMGQLLTILNDLNTPEGFQIDTVFWATANDISGIIKTDSAFLRKGRFDELFFVNTPKKEEAQEIYKLYIERILSKNNIVVEGITDRDSNGTVSFVESADKIIYEIVIRTNSYWRTQFKSDVDIDSSRYVYTPAEIRSIIIETRMILADKLIDKGVKDLTLSVQDIEGIARRYKPIQFSMTSAIKEMRSQRGYLTEV